MRNVKLLFKFVAIAFGASAADITGTWKAVFVDGEPKVASEVILHLAADGAGLRGSAQLGALGEAAVVDGKVAGDRISFTVYPYPNGRWTNKSASGEEAGGLTKLIFVGTVQGSEIKFLLNWGAVTQYGTPPAGKTFELKATRTAD